MASRREKRSALDRPGGRSAERRRVTAGRVRRPSRPPYSASRVFAGGVARAARADPKRRAAASERAIHWRGRSRRRRSSPQSSKSTSRVNPSCRQAASLTTRAASTRRRTRRMQITACNRPGLVAATAAPRETDCGTAQRAAQMQTGRRMSQRRNHRRRNWGRRNRKRGVWSRLLFAR